ncbi:MAG: hypothetical protein ACK53T_00085 [Planctomycetota bacterium]|jgi:hypothetical protein
MTLSQENAGQVNERHIDRKTPVVVPSATTRTLGQVDADNLVVFQAAGAVTVTVPTDAVAPNINRGTVIRVATTGAGGLTIAGAGVTFTGAALTGAQNVTKEIIKLAPNAWFVLR